MLDAYEKALLNVGLSGPTNFSPIISTAAAAAQSFVEGYKGGQQRYAVLLIMTDGQITDMSQTIEAIARAATLPLSIIIVGVGRDDFSNMSILDGDERKIASRDIVQVFLSPPDADRKSLFGTCQIFSSPSAGSSSLFNRCGATAPLCQRRCCTRSLSRCSGTRR